MFYFIMIEKSTDVAILNEMVIYAHYVTVTQNVKTAFMKIVALFNGTADAIETALVECLESKDLSLIRLIGLRSDGARVMTGKISGVGTRLKRRQPMLTVCATDWHWQYHKQERTYPLSTRNSSQHSHSCFISIKICTVRVSGLKAIQELLKGC